MDKKVFLLGFFVLFFVGSAFAQSDLSISCGVSLVGEVNQLFDTSVIVTDLTPSTQNTYILSFDCDGGSGSTEVDIGGPFQSVRQHPISLVFGEIGSGVCPVIATDSFGGGAVSCNIPFTIGDVGSVPDNRLLTGFGLVLVVVVLFFVFRRK